MLDSFVVDFAATLRRNKQDSRFGLLFDAVYMALEHHERALLVHSMMADQPQQKPAMVQYQLVGNGSVGVAGQLIASIKTVRHHLGLGLKEAKDLVEAINGGVPKVVGFDGPNDQFVAEMRAFGFAVSRVD